MPDPDVFDVGQFLRDGFAVSRGALISPSLCETVADQIADEKGASQRHLIDHSSVIGLLAVRIHLDPCDGTNGPLRVLAGSDAGGRLSAPRMAEAAAAHVEHLIQGPAGSALFMRPLLVHASSKAISDKRRRVLHLEFAALDLPSGIEWHRRIAI